MVERILSDEQLRREAISAIAHERIAQHLRIAERAARDLSDSSCKHKYCNGIYSPTAHKDPAGSMYTTRKSVGDK